MKKNKSNFQSDIILAQKLVTVLVNINEQDSKLLWDIDCRSVLRFEHESTVLRIVGILGRDLFDELIDIRDENTGSRQYTRLHEFKKTNFEAFIVIANHEIEIQLGLYENSIELLPDYDTAWKLLCGLARLLDTSDQFFVKREDLPGSNHEHKVILENPFRAYLYRIVNVAQLQDIVSDTLYDSEAYAGEQSLVKPYQICELMDIDEFCNDLDVIEKFIRSMCKIKMADKFVFDIDEIIDGSAQSEMTLAKFIHYECNQQLK